MGMSEYRRTARSTLCKAASVSSEYRPRSAGEMRPCGSTPVASTISSPAPDNASCPRWMVCQSVAWPSSAEYWHMGAITMRLGNSSCPSFKEENNLLTVDTPWPVT
jgi:hypothetical protein